MTSMSLPIAWLAPDAPLQFPPPTQAMREPNGLLAAGGDLSPQRLQLAYASGIFPWYGDGEPILWWSPDPRCVFATDAVHVARSLRGFLRRSKWMLSIDRAFVDVVAACAAPRNNQPGTWINADMAQAYARLHRAGHAHSLEVWDGQQLVGGLYGVATGRAFSGESMFSRAPNASKVALLAMSRTLHDMAFPWLDAQVPNPHLMRMGARILPRADYLRRWTTLSAAAGEVGSWAGALRTAAVSALATTP